MQFDSQEWIGLAIGNSRNHWARFAQDQLLETWHTPHLTEPPDYPSCPSILASVVPAQTQLWQASPQPPQVLQLSDIPLKHVYPTFGIDRALAIWGAIVTYGAPILVIDGGTALTLTGADAANQLCGGAIFPGVRSLYQTLHRSTAALPRIEAAAINPDRWATNTENAIHSGIAHFLGAGLNDFIQDWQEQFPHSTIVFTGGDGQRLQDGYQAHDRSLQRLTPIALIGDQNGLIRVDPDLIFRGMAAVVQAGSRPGYPTAEPN
jgi:type III pantothenate kinase